MKILIGLGNPGDKYKNTRHNVGFMAIDDLAEKYNFSEFRLQKKSNALVSEGIINENTVILAKPQTFMNESGNSVKSLITNTKTKASDLIIIHDDIDLPLGKIKIVEERGSAGHKGVESIIQSIGNDGLIRVRIGIGGPKDVKAMKVVLKNFSKEEQEIVHQTMERTIDALGVLTEEGLERAMNEYNK